MIVLRAKVLGGWFVVNESTILSEGAEFEFVAFDGPGEDGLDGESRAASLEAAAEDLRHGRTRDADAVFASVASRHR